ncbi:DUF559 domain-containing protein [Microbacterium sp.]|uniref:DUF559 domain-containing protein n=1 Tax=Microbacterium sp. TaxID=51671 RepID=UPI0039E48345
MQSAAFILAHHGQIARGTLLRQYGLSRRRVEAEVSAGSIIRVRQGVFALPVADPAVITAAQHGGALTCRRALRLHGIWMLDGGESEEAEVHVWMGGRGRTLHDRADCGCIAHHHSGRAGLGIAPVEEALLHAYHCLDEETFFAALESALAQRKLRRPGLARLRARVPSHGRWLIDLARFDAESGLESLLRLRLHRLGIRLECQVEIPTVGRVDFVVGGRLILEADGRANHESPTRRHADRVRDAAASVLGYETLRFDYAQIVHDWPAVEAAIVAAVVRMRERD